MPEILKKDKVVLVPEIEEDPEAGLRNAYPTGRNKLWSAPAVNGYGNAEELRNKIEEYFESCYEMRPDRFGNPRRTEVDPPTWSGLARFLGFHSRQELLNYAAERSEMYSEVVADALLRLEEAAEKKLITTKTNATGLLAVLRNNAAWEDGRQSTAALKMKDASGRALSFSWADAPVEGDVAVPEDAKIAGGTEK